MIGSGSIRTVLVAAALAGLSLTATPLAQASTELSVGRHQTQAVATAKKAKTAISMVSPSGEYPTPQRTTVEDRYPLLSTPKFIPHTGPS